MFPSAMQWLIILLIILILFGASRLPKVSGDIAKSIKAFKQGLKDDDKTEAEEAKKLQDKRDDSQ